MQGGLKFSNTQVSIIIMSSQNGISQDGIKFNLRFNPLITTHKHVYRHQTELNWFLCVLRPY